MPLDRYTEVTSRSCGQNLLASCIGVFIGLALFVGAFPLLWWNEQRALERTQALAQAAKIFVTAQAERVDADQEGKLVYVTGEATTAEQLSDPTFGITLSQTLRLRRTVRMYQWKEEKEERTEKEVGGGSRTHTTYSYKKAWSEDVHDSAAFRHPDGHQNPAQKPYESAMFTAPAVRLGAFTLADAQLQKLYNFTAYPVDAALAKRLPTAAQHLKVHDGEYYAGANPAAPQIGDARISFATVPQGPVSLMAQQVGQTFSPYGDGNRTIHLVEQGVWSAEKLLQHAQQQNTLLTWILRAAGALMMVIGIAMCFGPITALANILPFLGNIAEAGTGCAAAGMGVALAAATIAVAWVAVRPLIGIPMLLGVVALCYLVAARGKGKRGTR